MLRRTLTLIAALGPLLLVATSLEAQAWKGRGRLQGVVKNEAGEPIEGAKVFLHPADAPETGPDPVETSKKGRWSFLGLKHGGWIVVVEAQGYITVEDRAHVSEFQAGAPVETVLPRNTQASIDVGEELLQEGRYAEAREQYEMAMEGLEPAAQARLRTRIADTYLQEGNYEKAREEYSKSLEMLEGNEQVHVFLQMAESYQAEGNHAAAREQYEKALPYLGPEEQARILMTVSATHDAEGQPEKAIQTLARAIELDPDSAQAIQLIADLLIRQGREAEAEEYLARMPEGAELPPDMLINIGIRRYNEGQTEEAIDNFTQVVEARPEMAEPYYYRGLAYLGGGQNDLAAADLNRFLELAPEHEKAAEAREFLKYLEP